MGTPTVEGPIVDILPGVTQYDTYFRTLPNGQSVFGYEDQFYSVPDDPAHVYIALINAETGSALRTVQLSAGGMEDQVTITSLDDGRFLVAWRSLANEKTVIQARVFEADGRAAGSEFVVSNPSTDRFYRTESVTMADGRVLLIWERGRDPFTDKPQIFNAQFFSASGQPLGSNFTILSNSSVYEIDPHATALAGGGVALTWMLNDGGLERRIYLQIVDNEGVAIAPPFTLMSKTINTGGFFVVPHDLTVTGLADGSFLVAWTEESGKGGDRNSTSVQAQIVGANGQLIGDQFLVNTTTAGPQGHVAMLALDNGGFVAVWYDGAWAANSVARGQYFMEGGAKSGAEFTVAPAGSMPDAYGFKGFNLSQLDSNHIIVEWGGSGPADLDHFRIIDLQFSLIQTGTDANNTLVGTRLGDTIFGGLGNDTITGNLGIDSLMGDAGNDVLQGGDGNDHLFGGIGNDQLFGGAGIDQLTGGIGDDVYVIDNSSDLIIERVNEGSDKIITSAFGIDLTTFANVEKAQLEGDQKLNLTGTAVGNELIGNGVANYIDAGAGGDLVFGGAGNDVLSGGTGIDRISGGMGADFFVFRSAAEAGLGATADQITDFTHGVDQLVITAFAFGSAFIGAAAFSGARQVRYDIGSGVISGDNDGNGLADWQIVLLNKPVLTAVDLIL
ncbi:hypothetical protein [Cypionkella sp.]|uniref:calcium-binding protein n=1 Tax=Cypionkella sp. TaxID=2811411 RepID=UPI002ABA2D1B|nr:hypothetical protein [Cypionkella sp.]MDZ4392144.1 hypothetical protein [Cypionkella sp.]